MKSDPTLTLTLRNKFVRDFNSRFAALNEVTETSVSDNDCFGVVKHLMHPVYSVMAQKNKASSYGVAPIPYQAFRGETDASKMDSFLKWFENAENNILFETISGQPIDSERSKQSSANDLWAKAFLYTAYTKGILWARHKIKQSPDVLSKLGLSKESINTSNEAAKLASATQQHTAKAEGLYLRAFTDLEGITKTQETQILRIINSGLISGQSPREMAKEIRDRIDKVGKHRSTLLARTETIRAHHVASIEEYRFWGIPNVTIEAEWVTAGDARVCSLCAPLNGKIFTLDEIETVIPLHPQCRCAALPYIPDENNN